MIYNVIFIVITLPIFLYAIEKNYYEEQKTKECEVIADIIKDHCYNQYKNWKRYHKNRRMHLWREKQSAKWSKSTTKET